MPGCCWASERTAPGPQRDGERRRPACGLAGRQRGRRVALPALRRPAQATHPSPSLHARVAPRRSGNPSPGRGRGRRRRGRRRRPDRRPGEPGRLEPRGGADPDPARVGPARPSRPMGLARRSCRCRRVGGRDGLARTGRGGRAGARWRCRARSPRRLHHPLRLRDHAGGGLGRDSANAGRQPGGSGEHPSHSGERIHAHRCAVARPDRRQRAPSPAHARGADLDRCAHGGGAVPVPRALHRRPADARRPLRAAAVRATLRAVAQSKSSRTFIDCERSAASAKARPASR